MAMVADGCGRMFAPGALLVENGRILAVDRPERIGVPGVPAEIELIERPDAVAMPALVNVHAHLDLTHLGIVDYTGDFVSWVDVVRAGRCTSPEGVAASVRLGIKLSRAGGTAAVGDIAGVTSPVPIAVQREESMPGVSFLEVFGVGGRQSGSLERLNATIAEIPADNRGDNPGDNPGVRLGVQPHAPYSVGPDLYKACARLGLPLATHLAETLEEIEFTKQATGPLADFLKREGVWDDSIRPVSRHPVDFVAGMLQQRPAIAAHLNYIDDAHLDLLTASNITVAYCPRASAYFGHPHEDEPQHRYRDMLERGVTVALGTDSMLCLDTPGRISVLDEMRLLHQRDGTDPATLLRMATVHGAHALGINPDLVSLNAGPTPGQTPGQTLGVIAVPFRSTDRGGSPIEKVLAGSASPEWIVDAPRKVDSSIFSKAQ